MKVIGWRAENGVVGVAYGIVGVAFGIADGMQYGGTSLIGGGCLL